MIPNTAENHGYETGYEGENTQGNEQDVGMKENKQV